MRGGLAGRVLVAVGASLLVAALVWRPVVTPMLVKFPTDLDQTTRYEGTFTVYIDQTTGAPLTEPVRLPLEIDRRIRTRPELSGADTVVVQELVDFRVAGTDQRERHQYVMDRRSMQNQDDPLSYSYDRRHVVDRAGTYRVNLPLGIDDDRGYRIWENEPGAGFTMVGDPSQPSVARHGLSLVALSEVFDDAPVTSRYREELRRQGFPLSISFDTLVAQLHGIDRAEVDAALAALPTSDQSTVAAARSSRLPLEFYRYNDGHALVEPRTGAIVDLVVSDEGISATVDLRRLDGLREALAAYRGPGSDAAAVTAALDEREAAEPARVYLLHYRQTPESVAEIAALTRGEVAKLDWAERYVPLLLAGLGVVVVVAGAVWWRWSAVRRRRLRGARATP